MAQDFEIEVVIDEAGEIRATVKGIKGKKCTDISKFLNSLGRVAEDRNTPDYYQQEHERQSIRGR